MVSEILNKYNGKYAKLAVLSCLVEPKSLSELGLFWYNENGRFYKQKARQEIKQAVEDELLIKEKTKYKANTEKLISEVYSDIKNKEIRELICIFWCHAFSQQSYLCCEAIKHMFNNNPEKAAEASLNQVLNIPLILHMLQEKDSEIYSLFVSMKNLESYTNIINIKSEKIISKAFKNLKEKTDWLDNLNKIVKNNGHFWEQAGNELKIRPMMTRRRK